MNRWYLDIQDVARTMSFLSKNFCKLLCIFKNNSACLDYQYDLRI